MPNKYATARRRHRDIDIERDLHALWQSERFENEATVAEALRVYDIAIRVEGWQTVTAWARAALTDGKILNAQLVADRSSGARAALGTAAGDVLGHAIRGLSRGVTRARRTRARPQRRQAAALRCKA